MSFPIFSDRAVLASSGMSSGNDRDMMLVSNGPGLMLLILTPSFANLAESYLTHVSRAALDVPYIARTGLSFCFEIAQTLEVLMTLPLVFWRCGRAR